MSHPYSQLGPNQMKRRGRLKPGYRQRKVLLTVQICESLQRSRCSQALQPATCKEYDVCWVSCQDNNTIGILENPCQQAIVLFSPGWALEWVLFIIYIKDVTKALQCIALVLTKVGVSMSFGVSPARTTLSEFAMHSIQSPEDSFDAGNAEDTSL